ncbi:MAG: hypothetical protein OEN21_10440 [Myxococcales bacterium]|nr:hypothetical protein [Myxococcales bacterium]
MRNRFLFLFSLGAALTAFGPTTFAQAADLITSIGGEGFLSDTQERFFNAANCADPAGTTFEDRIDTTSGTAVDQVYLWVGGQNSQCDLERNRTDITANRCQPVAGEAAQTLDINNLVLGLTLADLTETGLVDCANTALQGQPYELYAFRSSPPGAIDVLPENFGIALFKVDVTAPNPPNVSTEPPGLGESFTMTWPQPTDDLQLYRFYRNDVEDDPDTATLIEGVTADLNATSQNFSATGLGLEQDESTYLYATAVDKASAVPGNGNESDKSAGWMVTAAETAGFCDASGACTGCSVSPLSMISGAQSSAAWTLGLLFAALGIWRLRR